MPQLGADMAAGTVLKWRKKAGDAVRRDEVIADVETDKGVVEVQCFASGVLEKILVEEGETVPVGTPLAEIREEGKPIPKEKPAGAPQSPVSLSEPGPPPARKPAAPPLPVAGRQKISPLARRRAAELGVDLAGVKGTGPGRAVTEADVEKALAAPAEPQSRMRQAIAATMARSKREIPHFYLATNINLGRAMAWLAEENERRAVPERLLSAVLLIKAVALALREVPELNASWTGGRAVPSEAIHVGVAIFLRGGGLVAPALLNTDRQCLVELMGNFRDVVNRARAASFRSSELSQPTITVTSLGEQGAEAVYGVIVPPQVALVGFGRIQERPWVEGGAVVVRPVVTATLSADHRVVDGRRGSAFLAALDRLLQEPENL